MTSPAATAPSPIAAPPPSAPRFSEARLVPDTLVMAWRSLIVMVRNPGEFYDILIQPIMFTVPNPQLKSHYFRYVDKETLYFPLKNNINIKEFGISINIIPFYSTKCEKKMSLEKLIYYSWIKIGRAHV